VLLKNPKVRAWDQNTQLKTTEGYYKPSPIPMPRQLKNAASTARRVANQTWGKMTGNAKSIMKYSLEASRTNPAYVLHCIKQDGQALAGADNNFKGNIGFVIAAV
jgi:hypothetical protein